MRRLSHFYYQVKPYIPWQIRIAARRVIALGKRRKFADVWPISPVAGQPPEGWSGWPDGKKFAFVVTHDVESREGLEKCRRLMRMEMELGFRTSFNFIPEGEYTVPPGLRAELTSRGFEIGVHDLHHDGKLYRNRGEFAQKAARINGYLKEWEAVGFRSAFMLRNLDWLCDLNIAYDSSTFDTDPFEPQPDGVHTIFPFWVGAKGCGGYVEIPYTLPQDSTLFLILRETTPEIWLEKLDWVAQRGGLALVNIHPDHLRFRGKTPSSRTYPVAFYEKLLQHVLLKYGESCWRPLPREVAGFMSQTGSRRENSGGVRHGMSNAPARMTSNGRVQTATGDLGGPPSDQPSNGSKPKIWIDLDNTPHVPFFEPIMEELRARGYPLVVTARDAFQVCELADQGGMKFIKVGKHYGKNRLLKGFGLLFRAMQLGPAVLGSKPLLAVSHGARSQLILSRLLGIPTLLIEDYEYAQFPWMMRPTWLLVPEVIPDEHLCLSSTRVHRYPGIKEEVYAWKLEPDSGILRRLGIEEEDLVVTVRPPATEAHYHNPESIGLFVAFMERAICVPHLRVILLPRNRKQEEWIRGQWPAWFANEKTIIPPNALGGMNLIWHSDLVVSGGGTMNREAAALGVPVYSIFRGKLGAVDRGLSQEGKLGLIESVKDVREKIALEKRSRNHTGRIASKRTLFHIVDVIERLALNPANSAPVQIKKNGGS